MYGDFIFEISLGIRDRCDVSENPWEATGYPSGTHMIGIFFIIFY